MRHIHWAKHSQAVGQWIFDTCRCDQRRTRKIPGLPRGYAARDRRWPTPGEGWVQPDKVTS